MKKNNYLKGILGAFLGAILFGIPWVIVYVYGEYILSILALLIAFGSFKFYKLFGGKITKKTSLISRIKNSAAIIMPLVLSSLERIESISSAMELRAFGNSKKRTWYSGKKYAKRDYIAISIVICVFIAALVATKINGGRFFNPFL